MDQATPDTPSPSLGSTRTETCRMGCGRTTTATYTRVAGFAGRDINLWASDWELGDTCNDCKDARERKPSGVKPISREAAKAALEKQFGGPATTLYTWDAFDPIPNTPALEACRGFNSLTDSLYLFGPCGTGKTHLVVALAREQFAKGRSVAFYTVPALMREFRRRLDPDKEEAFLKMLWNVDVLVIDDLGVGKSSEYALDRLHEIIDGRQKLFKQGLVITSNLGRTALAEATKDRITDRLTGLCTFIKMEGESHRRKA